MGSCVCASVKADAIDSSSVGEGDTVSWQDGRRIRRRGWKSGRVQGRLGSRAEAGHAIPPKQERGQPAENHRNGRKNEYEGSRGGRQVHLEVDAHIRYLCRVLWAGQGGTVRACLYS